MLAIGHTKRRGQSISWYNVRFLPPFLSVFQSLNFEKGIYSLMLELSGATHQPIDPRIKLSTTHP